MIHLFQDLEKIRVGAALCCKEVNIAIEQIASLKDGDPNAAEFDKHLMQLRSATKTVQELIERNVPVTVHQDCQTDPCLEDAFQISNARNLEHQLFTVANSATVESMQWRTEREALQKQQQVDRNKVFGICVIIISSNWHICMVQTCNQPTVCADGEASKANSNNRGALLILAMPLLTNAAMK